MRAALPDPGRGVAVAALLLSLAASCATHPPATHPEARRASGEIIRVNARAGFVVAECAVLPSPGEEATVLRDKSLVGRIRFTPPVRFPYMAADVVEGRPEPGDVFEIVPPPPGTNAEIRTP